MLMISWVANTHDIENYNQAYAFYFVILILYCFYYLYCGFTIWSCIISLAALLVNIVSCWVQTRDVLITYFVVESFILCIVTATL